MSFPYFISPEQAMRERSELARKGIARGRSVVVLAYAGGVLFVAENPSRSLQKVSELYDRVGFAAVGRFNEFDNLRRGGIQFADTRGYAYDRRDVTGRQLANVYANTLGTIFTEQAKPYEVELCVAEVAHYGESKPPELYRITYDGSIADEPQFVVMGGTTEPISTALKELLLGERRTGRRGPHGGQRAAGRRCQRRAAGPGAVHARGRDPRREPAPAGVPPYHRSGAGSAFAAIGFAAIRFAAIRFEDRLAGQRGRRQDRHAQHHHCGRQAVGSGGGAPMVNGPIRSRSRPIPIMANSSGISSTALSTWVRHEDRHQRGRSGRARRPQPDERDQPEGAGRRSGFAVRVVQRRLDAGVFAHRVGRRERQHRRRQERRADQADGEQRRGRATGERLQGDAPRRRRR